jgi:hypothetical protein
MEYGRGWGGGEEEVQLKPFLILVFNKVNAQLQTPATLPPQKELPIPSDGKAGGSPSSY